MGDQDWGLMQEHFAACVDLDAEERAAYLDRECASPELRRSVERLLESHEQGRMFMESATESETSLPDRAAEPLDEHEADEAPSLPGFVISREIGRGGMGIVYEAERVHPRQSVALKVLKPSFGQPSLRRRFEHEIHLLARLQHPGIAQIYDAGVAPTPSGPVPYFAMELVEGRPLDEFARDPSIGLKQRLELLAETAAAVEHAHQKMIIHRDLKPSNILVTPDGRPKILDFGVARAIDPELQLTTLQTEFGQLIGTLPYMSPEQAVGDLDQLDTRSDVYSLGVVAYELIAGRPPYDLANKLIPEAVRVIQQEEPSRLSTIDRSFRGDIETIVAKALEKQRERRYQSVAEMAADIRRFLNDEPIVARPPSRAYLFRKFAKRHQPAVVSGAVVLGLLIAGVTVSSTLAVRLGSANRSLSGMVEQLREANAETQAKAETAQAVNEFYTDHLLLAAAPEETIGQEITLVSALENASHNVDRMLADHAEAAAYVHQALSSVYRRLDVPDRSLSHGEAALELLSRELGEDHVDTLHAMNVLAALLLDRARFEEGDALRARAIEGLRRTVGDAHAYTRSARTGHAQRLMQQGSTEQAAEILEELESATAVLEPGKPLELLNLRVSLAEAYGLLGRWDVAESTLLAAIEEGGEHFPDRHPSMTEALNGLGATLVGRGEFERALPITTRVAAVAAEVLGPDHMNALIARQNLARTLSEVGRFHEAEAVWQEVIPLLAAALPDPHPLVADIRQSYGIALSKAGRTDDAVAVLTEAHGQLEATLGSRHDQTLRSIRWIVDTYERAGNEDAAARWRERLDG